MIQAYQDPFNRLSNREVDQYCKWEDVSPLLIYRTAEQDKPGSEKLSAAVHAVRILARWLGFVRHIRLSKPSAWQEQSSSLF